MMSISDEYTERLSRPKPTELFQRLVAEGVPDVNTNKTTQPKPPGSGGGNKNIPFLSTPTPLIDVNIAH